MSEVGRGQFTPEQRKILLQPIKPKRVGHLRGQSHLPAYDVEAHLSRVFGFEGWDRTIVNTWLINEDVHHKDNKETGALQYTVTYGCHIRLTIYDLNGNVITIKDGVATGSATNQTSMGDAHDMAIKGADSYALKRAAKSFGDQFGLSLYNKGSLGPLVKQVIAYGEPEPENYEPPQTLGNDEIEIDDSDVDAEGTGVVHGPVVTDSGKVITDEDFEALAAEAETGFDVAHLGASEPAEDQVLSAIVPEAAAAAAPHGVELGTVADNDPQSIPAADPPTRLDLNEGQLVAVADAPLLFNAATTAEITTIVNTKLSREQRTAFREWRIRHGMSTMPSTAEEVAAANVALSQICAGV